ncbi:SigB/SigF/SigG family RNA polymerase sigma factor [Solirubrobacter ginsenosidimutans]|uniref:SigB/SigF/SigG family RNA polymerase sigma factor n=1 Tax=Solirubrobacter ginsenosidimutans TaxID=490573 RepID=A0A9X3N257_9ACTN|nr:SigB/SigF/SigG family RNA polymerase sigma factor [Solirubrobacter ginsenosidimutans]MDA0167256.1 SigB/SigF/SigG family RNA polymerase sigma factor [Solirubrobacter ginsenosidimutans]
MTEPRWGVRRDAWYQTRRAHERRLFARYTTERSPAARDAIMEQFLPLARKLARRYANVEEIEDLEQVAALGLIKAIERFDPERGLAFSSFAFPTILGELKRYLRDHGWSVRPPRDAQELAARLDHHTQTLVTELGRSPTVAELAQRTHSSVEDILEALQTAGARHAVSLDQPRHDADDPAGRGLEIPIQDDGFVDVENDVLVNDLLRALDPRDRLIVNLRFRKDLTQREIGEIVGISQMHVSRLLRTALKRLQDEAPSVIAPEPIDRVKP